MYDLLSEIVFERFERERFQGSLSEGLYYIVIDRLETSVRYYENDNIRFFSLFHFLLFKY